MLEIFYYFAFFYHEDGVKLELIYHRRLSELQSSCFDNC